MLLKVVLRCIVEGWTRICVVEGSTMICVVEGGTKMYC